jgi:hypothetical protein
MSAVMVAAFRVRSLRCVMMDVLDSTVCCHRGMLVTGGGCRDLLGIHSQHRHGSENGRRRLENQDDEADQALAGCSEHLMSLVRF